MVALSGCSGPSESEQEFDPDVKFALDMLSGTSEWVEESFAGVEVRGGPLDVAEDVNNRFEEDIEPAGLTFKSFLFDTGTEHVTEVCMVRDDGTWFGHRSASKEQAPVPVHGSGGGCDFDSGQKVTSATR